MQFLNMNGLKTGAAWEMNKKEREQDATLTLDIENGNGCPTDELGRDY